MGDGEVTKPMRMGGGGGGGVVRSHLMLHYSTSEW